MIDTDEFWTMIEASAAATGDPDERAAWLTDRLARRPADEAIDFALRLDEARARADTYRLWGAALHVCNGLCSDDGFHYFQAWLVGLGRETFELVVADPDALADVPQVRRLAAGPTRDGDEDDWPDWEDLNYVADDAYSRIVGPAQEVTLNGAVRARGRELSYWPDPADEVWEMSDPAERARRYPRLAALFPPRRRRRPWVCETARP